MTSSRMRLKANIGDIVKYSFLPTNHISYFIVTYKNISGGYKITNLSDWTTDWSIFEQNTFNMWEIVSKGKQNNEV